MVRLFVLLILLLSQISFAQLIPSNKTIQGEWYAGKNIVDPKVEVIKLTRVKPDNFGHGTFLLVKDTANFTLYYSPMCGNDCIWNYGGSYLLKANKLIFKFETYSQHGFCKKITKTYKKDQMKFIFLIEAKGKDTLVLKRQNK